MYFLSLGKFSFSLWDQLVLQIVFGQISVGHDPGKKQQKNTATFGLVMLHAPCSVLCVVSCHPTDVSLVFYLAESRKGLL